MTRASTHRHRPTGTSFTQAWPQTGVQMQPVVSHGSQKPTPGFSGESSETSEPLAKTSSPEPQALGSHRLS
ncbi:MAG: hypothetical protein CK538_01135 [Opitutia bacterium]|nr:MAG: hypothetical protein CK538_01135 [Opitutae bacterium]